MKYLTVEEYARLWNISNRSVRNYCLTGRIKGAVLENKRWQIPKNIVKPKRINTTDNLLTILEEEKQTKLNGRIYHKIQIELTYNSNHIEGSKLTSDQTRQILETNSIFFLNTTVNVDDIIETTNHFRCIDLVISQARNKLTSTFIKDLHQLLKRGTIAIKKEWFMVGEYKLLPNEVGTESTTPPEQVQEEMNKLLECYNAIKKKTLKDIINFHVKFESIHPFQDGNGRIGRLIMFKECLKNNIVPFIITDDIKQYYYRGLKEWDNEQGYLINTILSCQNRFKGYLDYFNISYKK